MRQTEAGLIGLRHRIRRPIETRRRGMARPKLELVETKSDALGRLVADYLAHLRARGLSPRTSQQAIDVLERRWLPWCRQHGVASPEQLDQRLLERWSAFLLEEHRTPAGE